MELLKNHKSCSKCKVEKPLTDFRKLTGRDNKYFDSRCRECGREYARNYKKNNPEKIKEFNKRAHAKNYQKNKESILIYQKSDDFKAYLKDYRKRKLLSDGDNVREKARIYKSKNKEFYNNIRKIWNDKNKERVSKRRKRYTEENIDRIRELARIAYQKKKNNTLFKFKIALRSRIYTALRNKGYKKNSKTMGLIGVDFDTLKLHLERQFKVGMNWDNHGEWHIDHIRPISSAKTQDELISLFHYTNLQPLWAKENLLKKDKIIEHQLKIAI